MAKAWQRLGKGLAKAWRNINKHGAEALRPGFGPRNFQ
jgi:hypothetical protein